ncbi:hypothetical protein HJFPF1_11579 [Paramyrothecium foliicola]|nr:hypothetical protein HJFPF1_11579 [Paramyrothecium foliicola]
MSSLETYMMISKWYKLSRGIMVTTHGHKDAEQKADMLGGCRPPPPTGLASGWPYNITLSEINAITLYLISGAPVL